MPDDLQATLDENPAAAAFFATLDSTNRYAVLYRIHDAKKPETRARRIEKFVAMLARGEKHPPPEEHPLRIVPELAHSVSKSWPNPYRLPSDATEFAQGERVRWTHLD